MVKNATGHLKGLTIVAMGCIVNGPGEMADADFGYVGSGPGKIDLYVGKERVKSAVSEMMQLTNLSYSYKKKVNGSNPTNQTPDLSNADSVNDRILAGHLATSSKLNTSGKILVMPRRWKDGTAIIVDETISTSSS